ncbi:MAG: hypothetical protein P4L45_07275 [Ignavibacteriaceae bacterium]|nr:hypothetical protein [Ignavibacteriaceae bacterium]
MKQMPKNLQHLFWDINVEMFNPFDYPEYTIGRVLEFGDEEAIAWLKGCFAESEIRKIVKSDRKLSPKSANFWAIIFGIPFDDIAVLRK